jgi:hypothetical protein
VPTVFNKTFTKPMPADAAERKAEKMVLPVNDDEVTPPGAPSVGFYALPAGFGIAFGIFNKGLTGHWAIDAIIISFLWGIGCFLVKSWKYRAYLANCQKLAQSPNPALFILLQTLSTGAVIFVVTFIVKAIRLMV